MFCFKLPNTKLRLYGLEVFVALVDFNQFTHEVAKDLGMIAAS